MDSLRPSSIFVFSQLPGDPVREQVTLSFRVAENAGKFAYAQETFLISLVQLHVEERPVSYTASWW